MAATHETASPAVTLEGLGRRYGRNFVLRDLNLVVSAGKMVVLQGANGAGKTTLLRVLATRLRPSLGRGRVFGHDLVKEAAAVRERTAYLSVLGSSYGNLTALENLRLAARLYGKSLTTEELEGRLAEVGLGEAGHKLVRSFSSGMKKRLGIARLMLAEADLWLLDEPYAALDERGKEFIDALLDRAKATGKTVLMASHELERSASVADSVLRLERGRLELVRPAEHPRAEAARV